MPPFPPPPLSTVRRLFVPRALRGLIRVPRSVSGRWFSDALPFEEVGTSAPEFLAPVWVVVSQSIHAYSTSSVPLAGASRFHRMAIYTGCLRCAGAPRRPTTGSVLSFLVPHRHATLYDPQQLATANLLVAHSHIGFRAYQIRSCPACLSESLTSRIPQSTDSRAT
jgi:hypothetical protein